MTSIANDVGVAWAGYTRVDVERQGTVESDHALVANQSIHVYPCPYLVSREHVLNFVGFARNFVDCLREVDKKITKKESKRKGREGGGEKGDGGV